LARNTSASRLARCAAFADLDERAQAAILEAVDDALTHACEDALERGRAEAIAVAADTWKASKQAFECGCVQADASLKLPDGLSTSELFKRAARFGERRIEIR
jgi:hypothetical protein